MSIDPRELAERSASLMEPAPMYGASDITFGWVPDPCPNCGPPPEGHHPNDPCPGCGDDLPDPSRAADTEWWCEATILGRKVHGRGYGESGIADAISECMERLRQQWRREARRLFRRQVEKAERKRVAHHVRYISKYPLPPDIEEEPIAADLLPNGKTAYVFDVSQARRIIRQLR